MASSIHSATMRTSCRTSSTRWGLTGETLRQPAVAPVPVPDVVPAPEAAIAPEVVVEASQAAVLVEAVVSVEEGAATAAWIRLAGIAQGAMRGLAARTASAARKKAGGREDTAIDTGGRRRIAVVAMDTGIASSAAQGRLIASQSPSRALQWDLLLTAAPGRAVLLLRSWSPPSAAALPRSCHEQQHRLTREEQGKLHRRERRALKPLLPLQSLRVLMRRRRWRR